jgi:hypothetical protein
MSPQLAHRCLARFDDMSASVQVFGCRHDDAIHALDGRRPKSAKARNRGRWGADGAAGAMGI